MSILLLSVLPAVLIVSAYTDVQRYLIPNILPIILVVVFPFAILSAGLDGRYLLEGLALGAGIIIVGFLLFVYRILGGGDAKLLAAAAPWFGFEYAMPFLVATAIIGGVLALIIMGLRNMPALPLAGPFGFIINLQESEKGIPYGVAIAAGGIAVLPETDLFLKVLMV